MKLSFINNALYVHERNPWLLLTLCAIVFFIRADEEAYVTERDDTSTGTHDWDRVCRMCDFNPKGTKNTKDVARMRSIFLQLKQNPLVR